VNVASGLVFADVIAPYPRPDVVPGAPLNAKRGIDAREAFCDATFAPAKKGDIRSERRNAAREQRSWR
jgi:hypothetical protein